ncbi:MAG: hypothetical protein AAFR14_04480, partial [Bacteroidota bacterium]
FQATGAEKHWEIFADQIDLFKSRREKVITSKILEMAVMSLLLFTLLNYRSYTLPQVELEENFMAQVEQTLPAVAHLTEIASLDVLPISNERVLSPVVLSDVQATSINIRKELSHSASSDLISLASQRLAPLKDPLIEILPIELIQMEPLAVEISSRGPEVHPITPDNSDRWNATNGWHIGMDQSFDANLINSDISLGQLRNQISGSGGHTVQILLGYRKGLIELNAGIGYAEKSFAPGRLTQYKKASANSFLRSSLDEVNFKQMHIPLNARIYLAPKQKTSFYLHGGINANVLMETSYAVQRSIQPNARPSSAPGVDVIDLANPPKGFANGGGLADNFYMSGVWGVGVSSTFANGISWYVQPQFQQSFGAEINELANRVNTISIGAGVKFKL